MADGRPASPMTGILSFFGGQDFQIGHGRRLFLNSADQGELAFNGEGPNGIQVTASEPATVIIPRNLLHCRIKIQYRKKL